jgi:solute carrier family 35 (GDP-fucose transporter), member C1
MAITGMAAHCMQCSIRHADSIALHCARCRLLLLYNTILAMLVLLPLILVSGELPQIMEHSNATDANTWFLIILAGILGFAINIVVYLLLKLTSPLTHNITGQLKGAVQTILAFYLFQNPVTIMVCGI